MKKRSKKLARSLPLLLCALSVFVVSPLLPKSASAQVQRERGLKVGMTREEVSSGRKVRLWAVIIGISRYMNGDQSIKDNQIPNLKSAGDDAQEIYNFLYSDEGGGFRDVREGGNMILLKDEQATKVEVERALASLKQTDPDDFFIIYIAAHGALVPHSDPISNSTIELPFFVLYDTDLTDMEETGLRMEAFRQLVSEIPAKKGLVLSDTCHSAGVQLAGRDTSSTTIRANIKYLGEMEKIASGVGFISAADQLEQSYESDILNQGVFTYYLLEALRGNADDNQDGIVTFNEVVKYLRDEVPKFTNQKQHPHYNTTTVAVNYIPLSIVRYGDPGESSTTGEYGTLVIRTPDIDGVEVAIDGSTIGTLNSGSERTVRAQAGMRKLSFTKGKIRQDLQARVEPGRSKIVEVNVTFTQSNEDALVEPTDRQLSVFLGEEKEPSKEAKDLFLKGVDSFNKQKFKAAVESFDRAIKSNGGAYADALIYRGRTEQSQGQSQAAVASFKMALALRPSDFEVQTLLVEAKFNAGYNIDEVVKELRDIIKRHPNFEFGRVVLGDLLFSARDMIGAERQLRRAILINPRYPQAHLILADVLTYQNSKMKQKEAIAQGETALQLFEEVTRKQVSLTRGLKRLSISHVIFGGARYANNAAIAEAHHILAKALTRMVERDETLANPDTYLDTAQTHIEEAIRLARELSDKHRLALALDTSALNYLLKRNVARAIEEGETALKVSSSIPDLEDFPDAHYTLYSAYKSDQKFSKAAKHLEKYIEGFGSQMDPDERARYKEELAQLQRTANANHK